MSSKRRLRAKECGSKRTFLNFDDANASRVDRTMRPYVCRFCGAIHLGHPPARVQQSAAAKAANRRKRRGL